MPAPLPDEQVALLRAVAAHPDEDTPRLAYADWLEEHGDAEQAAFIRRLIELDRQFPSGDVPEPVRRERHALTILADNRGPAWLAALGARYADPPVPEAPAGIDLDSEALRHYLPMFVRGFAEEVFSEYGPDPVIADAGVLFDLLPVQILLFQYAEEAPRDEELVRLAAFPGLARLRTLGFLRCTCRRPESWHALFRSPHLGGLRFLMIINGNLADDDVAVLAGSPGLAGLAKLDLNGCGLGPRAARALLRSPHLAGLTHLWFAENLERHAADPETGPAVAELRARFGDRLFLAGHPGREHR